MRAFLFNEKPAENDLTSSLAIDSVSHINSIFEEANNSHHALSRGIESVYLIEINKVITDYLNVLILWKVFPNRSIVSSQFVYKSK